jgi:LPXTG-site transpeptidase (sortase) family protein
MGCSKRLARGSHDAPTGLVPGNFGSELPISWVPTPRIAQMFGRALVLVLCLVAAISPDAVLPNVSSPIATTAALPAVEPGAPAVAANPAAKAASDPFPVRLVISKIGVDAKIEARGLDSSRNMLTPKDFHDVAWYNLGPAPGAPGNALLNGHVDWWTGSAVFTRLSQLRPGDMVAIIRGDGTRLTFKVTGRRIVTAGARVASLFAPSKVSSLTLITCTGPWDPSILSATHRLLVSAVLV